MLELWRRHEWRKDVKYLTELYIKVTDGEPDEESVERAVRAKWTRLGKQLPREQVTIEFTFV